MLDRYEYYADRRWCIIDSSRHRLAQLKLRDTLDRPLEASEMIISISRHDLEAMCELIANIPQIENEALERAAQVADGFASCLNAALSEGRLHHSVEANTYYGVSTDIAAAIRALGKEG